METRFENRPCLVTNTRFSYRSNGGAPAHDTVTSSHSVLSCHAYARSTRCVSLLVLLLLGALAACAQIGGEEITVASVRDSVSSNNRLALNRLALNRLALNRLALNRLALNGVIPSGLEGGAARELLATEGGRELLRYVVQCALKHDDALRGTIDGQTYEFPGLLGLVPKWKDDPLSQDEQQLMSACLLAHVNALGVSVSISVRGRHAVSSTEEERRAYPVYEGTFLGQVFDGETMKAYSCQGSASEAAEAHSHDRAQRRCTDGAEACAIVSLGRCRDVCERRDEGQGWSECWANGVFYEKTISVYLFADDAHGQNQRCESNDCALQSATGMAAILDCNGKKRCSASCPAGATCSIDGTRSEHFDIDVAGAELAEVDCFKGDDCSVACTDQARCEIECTRGKDCAVACSEGSSCDVDCHKGKDCAVTCSNGASCDVDCQRGDNCQVACSAGSTCDVTCGGRPDSCENIDCQAGSTCMLQCKGAEECRFAHCQEGAACLLDCNGAERCEFAHCAGGATTCADGIIACGRSCP